MALMKINIKCCWQQPIERTGAKTARRAAHFARPLFSHSHSLSLSPAPAPARTAVSEDPPTDFNAIQQLCTRCQARPANVLLVPPKNWPRLRQRFLPFLANARSQEPSRTTRHGVAFWWCLPPCAFTLCPCVPQTFPPSTLGVRVCWSCHGSAIVKFNQGNLCASIAYRDKLT